MLLRSVFVYCSLLFGVASVGGANDAATSETDRSKRGLDLGVLLRNVLQQSAALSNSPPPPPRMRTPRPMPTTTRMTTTTAAPPMMPGPFLQKTFYKVIPGVGGFGYGFNIGGNLGPQPFFFPNNPRGAYINFNVNDGTAMAMAMATTPMPTTAGTTAAAAMPAPSMPSPPAPQPVPMGMNPMPAQNMQPQPPQPPQPPQAPQPPQPPQSPQPPQPPQSPSAQQPQQPQPKVIYQYVPAPYFNAQTPPSRFEHNFATAPDNYDYYDTFNAQHKIQTPSYDYPAFFSARPAVNVAVPRPRPAPASSQAAPPAPQPAPAATSQTTSAELSENLIYQYTQPDDIYSKDGGPANDNDGVAVNSGSETSNDAPDATNDVDDDSTAANNDANNSPSGQQNGANIEYADRNPFSDTPNYGYASDDHQNKVPYFLKPSALKSDPFVYTNQPLIDHVPSHQKHSAFASMRFQTPFASFHTSTVNHGRGGQKIQPYQTHHKYF